MVTLYPQNYSPKPVINGVKVIKKQKALDESGSFFELFRPIDFPEFSLAQVNFSTLVPGGIKAFHIHPQQTDIWYSPPWDRLLVILHDITPGSPTEGTTMRVTLGGGTDKLLVIPPWVAHGVKNIGTKEAALIYFVDCLFDPDPQKTQELRLPWDHLGAEVWDLVNE